MRRTLRWLLVASYPFVGALVWAHEPVITSVSGTLVDGGASLVIQGTNLGTKTPVPVLKYDRFNDGPEYGPIGDGYGRGNPWYSAEQFHVNGPHYSAANLRGPHDIFHLRWDFEVREPGDSTQWWGLEANNIGRMGYMDFWFQNSVPDIGPRRVQMWSFHETGEVFPGPYGGAKAYETILFPYDPAYSVWISTAYSLCRSTAPPATSLNDDYFWYRRPDKEWHKIAVQWRDVPGSTVGQYKVWLDEQLIADISGNLQGCMSGAGVPPLDLDWIMFYHWLRNDCDPGVLFPEPGPPTEDWFDSCAKSRPEVETFIDDLYIDDQWSRIEICDSDEWASRRHCETQIVKDWDNTLENWITFGPTQGTFGDGETAYLYVIHQGLDSQGHYTTHVNGNGHPVTWLSACPETHGCAGGFCQPGLATSNVGTGLHSCRQSDGEILDCGAGTVHVVTRRCRRAACCTGNPMCSPCPADCGDTVQLACQ